MGNYFFRKCFSTLIITVLKTSVFLIPLPYRVKNFAR